MCFTNALYLTIFVILISRMAACSCKFHKRNQHLEWLSECLVCYTGLLRIVADLYGSMSSFRFSSCVCSSTLENNETLNLLEYRLPVTTCGIFSNWRRIAYFDTTHGDSCPTGLCTVTNTATNQTACGRTGTVQGCTSVTFLSTSSYTRVYML